MQGPGETVYVPGGWWHAVLNLDLTVAVTHNCCSSTTFPAIWAHALRGRPKMSACWLSQVHQPLPERSFTLAQQSLALALASIGMTDFGHYSCRCNARLLGRQPNADPRDHIEPGPSIRRECLLGAELY